MLRSSIRWITLEKSFAALAFLFIWVTPRGISGHDAGERLQAIEGWVKTGALAPIKYSIIGPLFSSPLLLLGQMIGDPHFFIISFNAILVTLLLGFHLRYFQKKSDPQQGYLFVLFMGFFSTIPLAAQNYDAEVFSMFFICLGMMKWTDRKWMGGSLLMSLGIANTPALIPASILLAGYAYWLDKKDAEVNKVFLAPAAGLLLYFAENLFKFESFMSPYLGSMEKGVTTVLPFSGLSGFSYPFILGLAGILFSFGKGLVFFLPASLLNGGRILDKKQKNPVERYRNLLFVFLVGMILTYSKWWSWYGGFSWGPRFFIIASVLSSLYFSSLKKNSWSWLLLFWQGWVCFEGSYLAFDAIRSCLGLGQQFESLCWYSPEYSPLFFHLWHSWPALPLREWIRGLVMVSALWFYVSPMVKARVHASG